MLRLVTWEVSCRLNISVRWCITSSFLRAKAVIGILLQYCNYFLINNDLHFDRLTKSDLAAGKGLELITSSQSFIEVKAVWSLLCCLLEEEIRALLLGAASKSARRGGRTNERD